jgi:DNA adenine methylase Dam
MKNNKIYIVSPLNYPGNKYRILSQLYSNFPKFNSILDLFCGSATVGVNSEAEKVICVDSDEHVISLLNFFKCYDHKKIIEDLIFLIKKFNLTISYTNNYSFLRKNFKVYNDNNGLKSLNSEGFYKLRDTYNNFENKFDYNANLHLYLLLIYGFNTNLRFNKKGFYNLPVGKTDLNKNNVKKILSFTNRLKEIDVDFICLKYNDPKIFQLIKKVDFVYLDPPYLITNAVYNENGKWTDKSEVDLLKFLDMLIKIKKNFGLSNILKKDDMDNNFLINWIEKNKNILKIIPINYHYRSSSYNKLKRNNNEKEILVITNYV